MIKKKHDKNYMPKKAVQSGTQGKKNKDLKMHIDLTGSNKVSILDKSPLDKSPPTAYRVVKSNRVTKLMVFS